MFNKVWGRCLGDAVGERRPPNTARTKHVPQTFNPTLFGDVLGDATGLGRSVSLAFSWFIGRIDQVLIHYPTIFIQHAWINKYVIFKTHTVLGFP
jgi:hypothetical protein